MTTIDINEIGININDIVTAFYSGGEPFAVEGAAIEDVEKTLSQYNEVDVYTAEDGDDFEDLCIWLDYRENHPSKVYVVGYAQNAMGFATEIF